MDELRIVRRAYTVGPQGPRGPLGPVGPKGEQGPIGLKGDKGDMGPIGPRGFQGPQGEKGDKGDVGPIGPQGLKGDKGDPFKYEDFTSEQLEQLRGPQGIQGPAGPKGDQGPQGILGPKGADGTMTFEDLTEEQKESLRGPLGIQGIQGEQGPAGQDGSDGADGQNGAPGQDGVTPHIDSTTGNWFIGTTDTGVHALGPAGLDGNVANQLQADWNLSDNTQADYIKNKPTIPTKTSDLTNDSGFLTSHLDISGKANTADLATVATSGDYNDLINKPSFLSTILPENNNHTYVDLGLPSGTLWATMNVGASSETDFGNYYMYGKGSRQYNDSDSAYSGIENPLNLSVDTARQVWGEDWRTPTKDLWNELLNNTTHSRTTVNGVDGYRFVAQNGNYIFVPCAKSWSYGSYNDSDNIGEYWTSTPYDANYSYTMSVGEYGQFGLAYRSRILGFTIRGVLNNPITEFAKVWRGTQAEYDLLTPDNNTIYIITSAS